MPKLFTLPGTVKGNSLLVARFLRMRSVSWIAHFGHETDMHPIDLIRDSFYVENQIKAIYIFFFHKPFFSPIQGSVKAEAKRSLYSLDRFLCWTNFAFEREKELDHFPYNIYQITFLINLLSAVICFAAMHLSY